MKQGVVAVVYFDGKILIGKKRRDSSKFFAGKWHIPGETIEENEDDKSALIRGLKEEAGIRISVGNYIANSMAPNYHSLRWYECFADSNKIIVGSDLEEARWILKERVLDACDKEIVRFWSKDVIYYLSH